MDQLKIDPTPLMRPYQVESTKNERRSLESKLKSPYIEDKGEVMRQIKRVDKMLATQMPTPFSASEKDAAIKLEKVLLGRILEGMPSHAEMRCNPPGALDKHQAWERRTKQQVAMWKNLQLRLNAGGQDGSVANLEKHRPRVSTLSMDNAQIQPAQVFLPPSGVGGGVVFSDEQLAVLERLAPGIRDQIGMLTNEQRAEVKSALSEQEPQEPEPEPI